MTFDLSKLFNGPVPPSFTLAETRGYILNTPAFADLKTLSKRDSVFRIRFYRKPERVEFPEDYLLSDFQKLAAQGRASIEIDDAGGGTPVAAPEPELV